MRSTGLAALADRGNVALGLVPLLLRLEMRRPAAWIAAACGAASGTCGEPHVAVAAGALAMVAGLGDTPAAWPTLARGLARSLRVAGPLAACLVVAGMRGGPSTAWACLGMVLAAATAIVVKSPVTTDADAATATLVCAAAAIGTARMAGAHGANSAGLIVAVWLTGAALAAWWERRAPRLTVHGNELPRSAGAGFERGPLPTSGPTRRLLGVAAMASTLAAMAGGLLLSPEYGPLAMALTVAWYASLALPAALLQDGEAVRAGWGRLLASSAAGPARLRWQPLGWLRFAGRVVGAHAAILGWPVLVAWVVGLASPVAARPAGITLMAVCGAAAAVVSVAVVCARLRSPGETAFAIAAALVVGGLWLTPSAGCLEADAHDAGFFRPAPESRC